MPPSPNVLNQFCVYVSPREVTVVPETVLLEFKFPLTCPFPATLRSEPNVVTPPTFNVVPTVAAAFVFNIPVVVVPAAVIS